MTLKFKLALAILLLLPGTVALAQDSFPRNTARISVIGTLVVFADTSAEAGRRCEAYEVPFTSVLDLDSLDLTGSRFGENFGAVPQIEKGPVIVRRGIASVEEETYGPRLMQVEPRSTNFVNPEFRVDLDIVVVGCARIGGMRVTDIFADLEGEVSEFRMGIEASLGEAAGSETQSVWFVQEIPRPHYSGEGYAIGHGQFEDVFGFSYQSRHLGVLQVNVGSRPHSFPAILEGRYGIEGTFGLYSTLVLLDGGLGGF